MEYLLFLERRTLWSAVCVALLLLIPLFAEIRRLRIFLADKRATRKRPRKERPSPWGSICTVVVWSAMIAFDVGYCTWRMHQFHLDRTGEPARITAPLLAIEHRTPYRGPSYDELKLGTEDGTLYLRISEESIGEYALTEKEIYTITYYPRTRVFAAAENPAP